MLRKRLQQKLIITEDNIPDSYFELQKKIAFEQGRGAEVPAEITSELRQKAHEVLSNDQVNSLDIWINYLVSQDSKFLPTWSKYWVLNSVVKMSSYDKEKQVFGKREPTTVAPFPDLNQEALTKAVDWISQRKSPEYLRQLARTTQLRRQIKKLERVKKLEGKESESIELEGLRTELHSEEKKLDAVEITNPVQVKDNPFAHEKRGVSDEDFFNLLSTDDFAKYYAFAIEYVTVDNSELLKIIDGEWKCYKQYDDHTPLVESLQGHGTGWCTAGEWTAREQLHSGDFNVFYSKNTLGVANIPRLAIRMEWGSIAEVRGVAENQNIDQYIGPVLEKKLIEFGEQGERYRQQVEDMDRLTNLYPQLVTTKKSKIAKGGTEIYVSSLKRHNLSASDLRFLYEIDREIQNFGYNRDPRIDTMLSSEFWWNGTGVDNANDIVKILSKSSVEDKELLLGRGETWDKLLSSAAKHSCVVEFYKKVRSLPEWDDARVIESLLVDNGEDSTPLPSSLGKWLSRVDSLPPSLFDKCLKALMADTHTGVLDVWETLFNNLEAFLIGPEEALAYFLRGIDLGSTTQVGDLLLRFEKEFNVSDMHTLLFQLERENNLAAGTYVNVLRNARRRPSS